MSITSTDQTTFQNLLQSDPEIQAVIQSVWGNTPVNQRPSNTPKNLEGANDAASKKIAQILASRGVQLPPHSFINPRTASLEGQHGWAGLPTAAKIAIIAGVAATGIGAAGAMGAFGGAATAGSSAGATGGAAGGSVGGAAGGTLASTSLSSIVPQIGAAAATGGNLAGGAGAGLASLVGGGAAKAASGGLIHSLMNPTALAGIGKGVGAIAQSKASNRGTQLDAMMEGDKMKMQATQARAEDESGLWRKIQAANYIKNGGMPAREPMVSSSGATIPDFSKSFGPAPISEDDKQMAGTLLPQLQDRLAHPPVLSDYASKMNPGKVESALDWLGPIISGVGAVKQGQIPPIMPNPTGGTTTKTQFRGYGE